VIVQYVDDMLDTGPDVDQFSAFKTELHTTFEMSDLGPLHYYLGIQFLQRDDGIVLLQSKYILKLLKRFQLVDCKPVATPVESGTRLSLQDPGGSFDATLYQMAVGDA
ncbi:hypothetical protein HX072_24970, partial [Escherichia coli]|uniref:reverse transcriptase domain-containing protein n=1 Tax=Escherichia coli TaxID=562 RepID=UPI00257577EC